MKYSLKIYLLIAGARTSPLSPCAENKQICIFYLVFWSECGRNFNKREKLIQRGRQINMEVNIEEFSFKSG